MVRKSKREILAFYKDGNYHLLVERIISSIERIGCTLRDEKTKKSIRKQVYLDWGRMDESDRATINKTPRNASWKDTSKIEITLSLLTYSKFHTEGKVSARYSTGKIFLEKVDNLEDYL